jgi:hypothetical protein
VRVTKRKKKKDTALAVGNDVYWLHFNPLRKLVMDADRSPTAAVQCRHRRHVSVVMYGDRTIRSATGQGHSGNAITYNWRHSSGALIHSEKQGQCITWMPRTIVCKAKRMRHLNVARNVILHRGNSRAQGRRNMKEP